MVIHMTSLPLELVDEISRLLPMGSRAALALSCKCMATMLFKCFQPLLKPKIPFTLSWKYDLCERPRVADQLDAVTSVIGPRFGEEWTRTSKQFRRLSLWSQSEEGQDVEKFLRAIRPDNDKMALCGCCLEFEPTDLEPWKPNESPWWQQFRGTVLGDQLLDRHGEAAVHEWLIDYGYRAPDDRRLCPPCVCIDRERHDDYLNYNEMLEMLEEEKLDFGEWEKRFADVVQ